MTVNAGWSVVPVARPEPPKDQVRALWFGKSGQPVDSAVFATPIACANVIDPLVARVSERGRLLRREVAALRCRNLLQFVLPFVRRVRVRHKKSTFSTYYAALHNSTQVHISDFGRAT
jgi:hypothetical protein